MQCSENFIAFHEIMKKIDDFIDFQPQTDQKRAKNGPKMHQNAPKKDKKKKDQNGRKMAEKWPKNGRKMVLKIDTTPEREKCKERKSLKNSTLKLNLISRNVLKWR